MRHARFVTAATAFVMITLTAGLLAQRGGGYFGFRSAQYGNVPYNGRFTFTRVRYGGRTFGRGSSSWNHDYPQADMHLTSILDSLTSMNPNREVSNILDLEDPEIFSNPVLYMWEPGYWRVTPEGAENLRKYLLKGGFIIFDDFELDHFYNMEGQLQVALPWARFQQLDTSHPVFHAFFDMDEINVPHPDPYYPEPTYHAVFEDNDPQKRIMALANHNNDVAEYWEWSDRGFFSVDTTNDAYKLGINYMVYALTH